jgi:ketosteroid isomerase-like protein
MPGTQSDIAEIEQLEDRRYAAMLAADLPALEELLHHELVYAHSTGGMDSKEAYIASLRDEVTVYKKIVRHEQTVRITGNIGLAFSHTEINAEYKGADLYLDNRMLAVWLRENGAWRLLALQSGAIPPGRI